MHYGRRAALKWLMQNTQPTDPGIVYFADDDNTYDVELFAELRKTRRISMFPVGLIHPSGVSSPVLNDRGKVTGKDGEEPWNQYTLGHPLNRDVLKGIFDMFHRPLG